MNRALALALAIIITACFAFGKNAHTVLVDSATHVPLSNATIFDRRNNAIGMSSANGRLPYISDDSYPIVIRYLGYEEKTLQAMRDTVLLQENPMMLSEVVVETPNQKMLHMLGYVREYSTLSTYTDTVFLFREKMVDFMVPFSSKSKFRGWRTPRIMKSKSYYRFTDSWGLDSVSDACNHHFSWSDWMGLVPAKEIPASVQAGGMATHIVSGKYSPTEKWMRNSDRVTVDIDVLADTLSRKWVPSFDQFFKQGTDFERFKLHLNCANVAGSYISPLDLTGYTYTIESRGRGREMFKFHRVDQPFFTSTYAEVYIIDKELITVKEAKRWQSMQIDTDSIDIFEPQEAPPLQAHVLDIIDRVGNIDSDRVRLSLPYDFRITKHRAINKNYRIGNRVLNILKDITGISSYKSRKHSKEGWNKFKKDWQNRDQKEN